MATCSVCGSGEDQLLYTCNFCGYKHCSTHRLPEKHACVPTESGSGNSSDSRWFSDKLTRSNLREDVSRSSDTGSSGIGPSNRSGPIDLKNHGSGSSEDEDDEPDGENFPNDAEAQRRRAREEMDRRLSNNTETKRPLDDDEIDSDQDSSPGEWVDEVKRNRDALNERLAERHRKWEGENSTSDTSEQDTTPADSTDSGESYMPRALLIVLLFVVLSVGYILLGNV